MAMKTKLKSLAVISVFLAAVWPGVAAGVTIYVRASASPGGNGQSWGTAYKYLQDGLADANSAAKPVEIWVADGTYKPDANSAEPDGTGDRTATFQLISGVGIYGGFAGGETSLDERDWQTYETILSGDLDGNDVAVSDACDLPNEPTRSENSYNVVTGSRTDATAVLDGFTIRAGNANGSGTNGIGGGMYNYWGKPTVANCTFSGNSASSVGGGMKNSYSKPRVTNCTFSRNAAYNGGGMHNGGDDSDPTLTNCTFSGNSARNDGGGMLNGFMSNSTVTNCTFSGNSAGFSGSGGGGGMCNYSGNAKVTNCTFSGNFAPATWGGGMYTNLNGNGTTITNCTFSGNSAKWGGGMGVQESSNPTVTNCTFSGNSAVNDGGGMLNWAGSPTVTNCILWGNTASNGPQIYGSVTVTYSDVEGGYGGTGNIDEDPLFADADGADNIAGTEDDNLRLMAVSPCIDAADNNSLPADTPDLDGDGNTNEPLPFDLDGHPRIIDGDCNDTDIVDMGAYEFNYAYMGDFDYDCDVDFEDFGILGLAWLTEPGDAQWNRFCDIGTPDDDYIYWADVEVVADNWLMGK